MRALAVWVVVVVAAAEAADQSASVRIKMPANDTVVLATSVTVKGTADGAPAGTKVTLAVNGTTFQADVQGGAWEIANVPVPAGMVTWTATYGGASHSILITKGASIGPRPQQKIAFVWGDGVEAEIRKIATATLDAALTPQQLDAYVLAVQTHTVGAFTRAYSEVDIEIVDQPGPNVHTVQFMKDSGDIFGQSFYDCGNVEPEQLSEIWVGTYRSAMTAANFETAWAPMKKSDSWTTRARDVGEALGRTSAHETGHSLGLVGSTLGDPCGWMRGCEGGHNCEQTDLGFPLANRFDNGWFIMDPGGKTLNNARLAEPSPTSRSPVRQPAVFNAFNASYFRQVHPKP